MQFAAVEMGAQNVVHPLLTLYATLAGELGTDDYRLKMVAVAFDLQVLARQAGGDQFLDLLRGAS